MNKRKWMRTALFCSFVWIAGVGAVVSTAKAQTLKIGAITTVGGQWACDCTDPKGVCGCVLGAC
jgi:hypothetical protein